MPATELAHNFANLQVQIHVFPCFKSQKKGIYVFSSLISATGDLSLKRAQPISDIVGVKSILGLGKTYGLGQDELNKFHSAQYHYNYSYHHLKTLLLYFIYKSKCKYMHNYEYKCRSMNGRMNIV